MFCFKKNDLYSIPHLTSISAARIHTLRPAMRDLSGSCEFAFCALLTDAVSRSTLRPSAVMRELLGGDSPRPRPTSSPTPIKRTPVLVEAAPRRSTRVRALTAELFRFLQSGSAPAATNASITSTEALRTLNEGTRRTFDYQNECLSVEIPQFTFCIQSEVVCRHPYSSNQD